MESVPLRWQPIGIVYNASMIVVWAWMSVAIGLRWTRLDELLRRTLVAWWGVGLVLVAARITDHFPASGHALWIWVMIALAFRLELSAAMRTACIALLALIVWVKTTYHLMPSFWYGSALGVPVALALASLEPYAAPARATQGSCDGSPRDR